MITDMKNNRRNLPPIVGKPPLLSGCEMFRQWYLLVDRWCTFNVSQPAYFLIMEIMRVSKEGNAGDRNCATRINKILETGYLEVIDVTFSTRDILGKIRGDYDLEEKEHKQRLENKRNLRHLMPIKVGHTCVELLQEIRELAVSLAHYGAMKGFQETAG